MRIIVLFLILNTVHGYCQINNSITDFRDVNNITILLSSNFNTASPQIDAGFVNKFYAGAFIDEEQKQFTQDKLMNKNQLGLDFNTNIGVAKHFNQNTVFLRIHDNVHFDASWTSSLYNFIMFGNKQYEGRLIDLGTTNFTYLQYKQFELGYIFNSNTHAQFGASLSFLIGNNITKFTIDEADFFTAIGGEYLTANWDGKLVDTSNDSNFAKGYGVSVSSFYKLLFDNQFSQDNFLLVEANNVGAIGWNKSTVQYETNGNLKFSGLEYDGNFKLIDTTYSSLSTQDVKNLHVDSTSSYYNTLLPAYIGVQFKVHHTRILSMESSIQHRFLANFKPYMNITEWLKINNNVNFGINFAAGGYNRYAYGFQAEIDMEKWSINLGSYAINSLVNKNAAMALNAFIKTRIKI